MEIRTCVFFFFKVSTIQKSSYVGLAVAVVSQVLVNLYINQFWNAVCFANSALSVSHRQVTGTQFCRTSGA